MKLLYCFHCSDVVRLFPEPRSCKCGKSKGYYKDYATTVQTNSSLSLGLHNHDFNNAVNAFTKNPKDFSPLVWIRGWINPVTEPDVEFVAETEFPDVAIETTSAEDSAEVAEKES